MLKLLKIFTLIFTLFLVVSPAVYAQGESDHLNLSAQHAYLYIPDAEISVYNKSAEQRHSMASTTKIMTALVALENSSLEKVISVSSDAVGIEGSSVYLKAGDKFTMESLLYALLLQSANDAAAAIAIDVGGSISGFADMMNEKAAKMGLKDTHFENPHGLDGKEHYTTARELALIAAEALKNPDFKKISSTYKKTISSTDGKTVRTVVNHNKMLKIYDGAIGVKTGFTKKTGRCLVSAAERDGLTLISVTLNAPDDWRDHTKLLNLGFEKYENKILAEANEISYKVDVINGISEKVSCHNPYEISAITEKTSSEVKRIIELNKMVTAPISAGDVLGNVKFELNGKIIASSPLVAADNVSEIKYKKGLFGFSKR